MSFKAVSVICAQFLIQSISAQCFGNIGAPLITAPCGGAWSAAEWAYAPAASLAASNGPGVTVSTASPLIPSGVSVLSTNAYEGTLAVGGALPFLGTVALEGALPTIGAGAVSYGCGNGAVTVTAEDFGAIGFGEITGTFGAIGSPLMAAPMAAAPMIASPFAAGPMIAAPFAGPWDASYGAADWAYAPESLTASNGPGVAVSTASPILPAGVSVLSDNAYEGILAVDGALPFLGTVAIEGALPTAGAGAVAYGCGNGAVGITAEDMGVGFAGMTEPFGFGAGLTRPLAFGANMAGPIAGPACGYGVIY